MKRNLLYPKIACCCLLVFIMANCRIPYDPPLKPGQINDLVVEGYIDGAAPTVIKLSRTRTISAGDTAAYKFETNARVSVEDDHQNQYFLIDSGSGNYSSGSVLPLNSSFKYRVRIFTSDGKEYVSELVPFKVSPVIDTIGWKWRDNGVQIFVNTHDNNNATRYYRWEYNETWEFHTSYYSNAKYNSATNKVTPRTDQVYTCWQYGKSTSINIGSTAKLSEDIVSEQPLVYIPPHDRKLSVLYSIFVKQYALDLNGYNYFSAMKKNTESIGSIFDPQPNQTPGNVQCVSDPSEIVVGYVGAGNSYQHRIYISNTSLPPSWNIFPYCEQIDVVNNPDSLRFYFGGGYSPIGEIRLPSGAPGYSASFVECVDCTFSGSNVKPPFWP